MNKIELLDVIQRNLDEIENELQKQGKQAESKKDIKVKMASKPSQPQSKLSGTLPLLEFDRESVKKGIIYSEILGKPRALRGFKRY